MVYSVLRFWRDLKENSVGFFYITHIVLFLSNLGNSGAIRDAYTPTGLSILLFLFVFLD